MTKEHATFKVTQLTFGATIQLGGDFAAVKAFRLYDAKTEQTMPLTMHADADQVTLEQLQPIDPVDKNQIYQVQALRYGAWVDLVGTVPLVQAKWRKYGNPISTPERCDLDFVPYLDRRGKLKVIYTKYTQLNTKKRHLLASGQLDRIDQTATKLSFTVLFRAKYPQKLDAITTLTLSYRGSKYRHELRPESVQVRQLKRNQYQITATFDKADIDNNIYKDSYILVVHAQKDAQRLEYVINEVSRAFFKTSHEPMRAVYPVSARKKLLVQVALNKNLWIHYRDLQELDRPEVREIEAAALAKYTPNLKNGHILMFEKEAQMAQDNAFELFKYLQTTDLKDKVFYVINARSPQRALLEPWSDQVLIQYTEKYYQYVIEAEMIVTSESLPHLYQFNMVYGNISDIIRGKRNYFLQHGVIGIRKLGDVFSYNKSGFDYFNASTSHEKNVVQRLLGYPNQRINILGLPRWDRLQTQDHVPSRSLLYFPTWREYLAYLTEAEFLASDYFKQIKALIEDERLNATLAANDYQLKVFLHPKMRRFTCHFNPSAQIEILDSSQMPLNQLIADSDAVISDYSSMVWDFAYQRKPIILFQFDQVKYEQFWHGFFDKSLWEFGPIVTDVAALNDQLDTLFAQEMHMAPQYVAQVNDVLGELATVSAGHVQLIKKIQAKKRVYKRNRSAYRHLKYRYTIRQLKQVWQLARRRRVL